jgi:ABC-type antimicrobial peptide transport system permease subunit
MALHTLREHKLRSALTVLGIVIGITALIAVASILVGLDRDIRVFLDDFGSDTLFVFKFQPGFRAGRLTSEERMRKPLTLEDTIAIEESCPAVKDVAVQVLARIGAQGPGRQIARYRGKEVYDVIHRGTTASYEQVFNAHVEKGRFFTPAEDLHRADIVVLGHDLGEALFPYEDPIGKTILVSGISYQVVGVIAKRKGQFLRNDAADKVALVPYGAYRRHFPADDEHFVGVLPYAGQKAAAQDQVRELLRRRRRVPFDKPDNFGISSAEEIATQFRQITGAIALVTVVVSSIGLLVGGVGVMNIMLMSVTERTREIGVRKAIGARQRDIIYQFLTEAMALTAVGGVIGVLFGVGISALIGKIAPSVPSVVPMWAIVVGVATSASVGLFFGIYPAVRAARLDPVEALRYE